MSDPGEQALAFLQALTRLPPYTGIVFHGLSDVPALERPRWTRGVTATSRSVRTATENFTTPALAAIVSRSGRDISSFSAHPDELEVVLPPEVLLQQVARITTARGTEVTIIEQLAEQDPQAGLPPTLDALVTEIGRAIADAERGADVAITTPGKFVEPLFFADQS